MRPCKSITVVLGAIHISESLALYLVLIALHVELLSIALTCLAHRGFCAFLLFCALRHEVIMIAIDHHGGSCRVRPCSIPVTIGGRSLLRLWHLIYHCHRVLFALPFNHLLHELSILLLGWALHHCRNILTILFRNS